MTGLWKLSLLFIFTCLVASPGGLYAQDLDFKDFDLDSDQLVEKYEFEKVFTRNYVDDWDNTDNTGLDDEDFYTFTYGIIDIDDDNMLGLDEWNYGYNYYYGDYLIDDFNLYDVNDDNYVSFAEYNDALYDTDYFVVWDVDRDNYLDEHELAERVFHNWDTNDNFVMNRSEFNNFDYHYADL